MERFKLRVKNGICICFTALGKETATRLLEPLNQCIDTPIEILDYTGNEHSNPLKQVVGEAFQKNESIIFIGAVGIAVRLIAPYVKDKMKDPAVLVIDECGHFAIPILSGHVGGCNELAEKASEILEGTPVITTATDLRQAFAVDVFAAENDLVISDRDLAKRISAAELSGEKIGFFSDYPVDGLVPNEVTPNIWQDKNIYVTLKQGGCPKNAPESVIRRDMVIGLDRKQNKEGIPKTSGDKTSGGNVPELLRLYPRTVILGMGCRRNSSLNAVRDMAKEALSQAMIDKSAIRAIATIDIKKNEMAFLTLAKEWNVELWSFTPEELQNAGTKFTESPFVKKTVGVGNVCERAAVMGVKRIYKERAINENNLPAIDLRVKKLAGNGVTAAIAVPASEQVRRQHWKKIDCT